MLDLRRSTIPNEFHRTLAALGFICALGAFCAVALAKGAAYRAAVEKWRADYEADLRSDHGWLTIAGLFWLHEGANRFGSAASNEIVLPESSAPADAGAFELKAGTVTVHVNPGVHVTMNGNSVETATLRPDSKDDRLVLDELGLWVHASGKRFAIRLRDKNSKQRRDFTGLHWFRVDESYRLTARYTPYDKIKQVDTTDLAGDSIRLPVSGYVTFTLHGRELRLEMGTDDRGTLTTVFRDRTSGKETYGAGRFVDIEPPKNGVVILDFNEAYNPPCAYNPYTTCPLPPPENRIPLRIEAGEKIYQHHDAK